MKSMTIPAITVLFCAVIAVVAPSRAAEPTPDEPPAGGQQYASTLCSSFNEFNSRIRDGLIDTASARSELPARLREIRTEYYQRGGRDYSSGQWVFPLAGYSVRAVGGGKSHGFTPKGYDFFSGNRHGGHPAYDIFIHDRNQDSRDDLSGKPVNVLSMTGGIVVAQEDYWQRGSRLRGGKYLWIYDPANELLVYYAHNDELFVTTGTIVKPGDRLATVGRSGFNAAKRRSPTHLHFSVLRLESGVPVPVRAYGTMLRAAGAQPEI